MSAPEVDNSPAVSTEPQRGNSDADIVRLALDWKLCLQADLKAIVRSRKSQPNKMSLLQQMLEEGLITRKQAERMESELGSSEKTVEQIPGYQLLGRIGSGGMGVVYKAKQLRMDRIVAIKLLKPKLTQNTRYVERFLREARLAAKLGHNHIVQAIDAGEAYGHHYLVMEYVEGQSVAELISRRGPFDETEAIKIVWQIAQALDHAHKKSMVHRDIKPENIIITPSGDAKLADMGLARFNEDADAEEADRGVIVGTAYYISPEQIRGESDIDSRADIYSLGVTLYTMLAGKQPFDGDLAREVLIQHLEKMPTPLHRLPRRCSDGVSVVVETMMAKERADRYPTPGDLVFDLECLLGGKPPRLAQERLSLRTLAELAQGEALPDQGAFRTGLTLQKSETTRSRVGLTVLTILFGLSLLFNVILLLMR